MRPEATSDGTIILMAVACGLTVAGIYANQPLLALIAGEFGVPVASAAGVAVATQLGYAAGLFFLVPLGDRWPRKRIVLIEAAAAAAALAAAAAAPGLPVLLAASFAIGLLATLVQQLVPLAAHIAPDERRGRVVGTVMSGLLFGILGGRIVAGFVGEWLGWRAVFALGALVMAVQGVVLAWRLPAVPPTSAAPYGRLLASVFGLAGRHAALRAAAVNGALMFGAFSLFWVALTPLVTGPDYGLDGRAAGAFGAVGLLGAAAAPLIGRWNDRFGPGRVLGAGVAVVVAAFIVFTLAGRSLAGLAIGVLLLDLGVQAALLANQARIFALDPAARSRVNAFFMTAYFLGGSAGSALAGAAWARFGWDGAAATGLALALAAGLAHVVMPAGASRSSTAEVS